MGEACKDAFRVNFDRRVKLEFHGTKVTSDAGLLAYRELDNALGLTAMMESKLLDIRKGKNTQHELVGLLRQSIYSRSGGYEDTNDAERFWYAIRLPANDVLYDRIDHLFTRPVGRAPQKPIVLYHSFQYRAASWDKLRRVVGKVEWHAGELFPRVGFIVTNLRWKSSNVVKFYNKRGTAEQWIKEGKYALNWT